MEIEFIKTRDYTFAAERAKDFSIGSNLIVSKRETKYIKNRESFIFENIVKPNCFYFITSGEAESKCQMKILKEGLENLNKKRAEISYRL